MTSIVRNQRAFLKKVLPLIHRRLVSTSNKKYDTVTVETVKSESKIEPQKNWVSYGYEYKNKEADSNAMHSISFISVTLCLVVGSFYIAYSPDYNLRDWAQREAYLELRRREENGMLPIDPNLIDPAKMKLPSDEELGDTEIII